MKKQNRKQTNEIVKLLNKEEQRQEKISRIKKILWSIGLFNFLMYLLGIFVGILIGRFLK
jgi:Trk-type K+ transport system membrane component